VNEAFVLASVELIFVRLAFPTLRRPLPTDADLEYGFDDRFEFREIGSQLLSRLQDAYARERGFTRISFNSLKLGVELDPDVIRRGITSVLYRQVCVIDLPAIWFDDRNDVRPRIGINPRIGVNPCIGVDERPCVPSKNPRDYTEDDGRGGRDKRP
jgi:hypothetical protein